MSKGLRIKTSKASTYIYYIASGFDNRNDWVPHLRQVIEAEVEGLELALDWSKLGNEFIKLKEQGEFNPDTGEETAARYAIRNTELNAVLNCDVFIVALPGGTGTFFEYGVAVATAFLTGIKPRVIVYAPNVSFVEGEKGHFIGLDGTIVVIGDEEKLVEAVKAVTLDIFSQRMQGGVRVQ